MVRNSFKKKVKISYGKTKAGKQLQELADKNAKDLLEKAKIQSLVDLGNDFNEVGAYLAEKLKLKNFPHKIECYDISHIQGTNTVASGICFINGMPKNLYTSDIKLSLQKVNLMISNQ